MDNRDGRWGQLRGYSGNPVYDVDYRWDSDTEERTKSWLLWDPPEDIPEEDRPEEIYWANECQRFDRFQPWEGFETRTIGAESFVPVNNYGLMEERKERMGRTLSDMAESFGVGLDSATPPAQIQGAKAVRDEARDRLEVHVKRLNEKVMEPLRRVFIACAVEATRAITGFQKNPEVVEDEALETWADTIQELNHLFSSGIGRGIRSEKLREHWYEGKFKHVPDPVAVGVRTALSVYVERSEEKKVDRSRDGILENARPVYFKWEAARRMVWSGLYDWPLESAIEHEGPTPSGPGAPRLTDSEEEVIRTLNAVCEWFDTNSSQVFEGDGGLANYVVSELPYLSSPSSVGYRMREICRQIEKKHPSLPVPDLESFTDGRKYRQKEEEIRRLRNEYAEHVRKK